MTSQYGLLSYTTLEIITHMITIQPTKSCSWINVADLSENINAMIATPWVQGPSFINLREQKLIN